MSYLTFFQIFASNGDKAKILLAVEYGSSQNRFGLKTRENKTEIDSWYIELQTTMIRYFPKRFYVLNSELTGGIIVAAP